MLSPASFGRFEDAYTAVLEHLGQRFEHVNAPRGNAGRECLNVGFVLEEPADRIVFTPARATNIVFCFAEALWYLTGRDDLSMISYYAPSLTRFSADGQTLTGSAYGPKIFGAGPGGGPSQWERVVELLTGEPASKRAVVSIFEPEELTDPGNPDVSCTLALQFLLRDGHLHTAAFMRGNDAYRGLLSDVFSFTLIQEFTARHLGLRLGTYGHHVASMHLNDADAAKAAAVVATAHHDTPRFTLPPMPATTWAELQIVADYERVLRRDEQQLDPGDESLQRLDPYWQQVALLLEAYRQISHYPGGTVWPQTLTALDPGYRWLLAHRWPAVIPPGFALPARSQGAAS